MSAMLIIKVQEVKRFISYFLQSNLKKHIIAVTLDTYVFKKKIHSRRRFLFKN